MPKQLTGQQILDLPMNPEVNDAEATTVRSYLKACLAALIQEGEGFSGKRPLGNSHWQAQLAEALIRGNAMPGEIVTYEDGEGYDAEFDYGDLDAPLLRAVEAL